MANDGMTKPRDGSWLKMCWPNREDNISYGPRTVIGAGIYEAGATPKVGYLNRSDCAAPLCHTGMFSGACSDCRLSLLNSLSTR